MRVHTFPDGWKLQPCSSARYAGCAFNLTEDGQVPKGAAVRSVLLRCPVREHAVVQQRSVSGRAAWPSQVTQLTDAPRPTCRECAENNRPEVLAAEDGRCAPSDRWRFEDGAWTTGSWILRRAGDRWRMDGHSFGHLRAWFWMVLADSYDRLPRVPPVWQPGHQPLGETP